jgi:hypothetical protein
MTRVSKNVNPGMRAQMSKLVMNHAAIMTGPRRVRSDIHSLRRYALGREIPVNKTWMPMTMRVIWKVSSFSASSSPFTQDEGLKKLAQYGPKMIPHRVASSASAAPLSDRYGNVRDAYT